MKRDARIEMLPLLVRREIDEQIRMACAKNGAPELFEKVVVEYSNAMTRLAGYARYKDNLIKLSAKLMRRASREEQIETVVHEACHLVAKFKHPETPGSQKKSHGWQWVEAMTLAGYPEARVYHTIPRTGLERKRREPLFDCLCRKKFALSLALMRRKFCPMCHGEIIPHRPNKREKE